MAAAEGGAGPASLESRPGVFLIGAPNVGKRTLLSSQSQSLPLRLFSLDAVIHLAQANHVDGFVNQIRDTGLLSIDFPETSDLSSGILCQGWTIETKYYSADISIWATNLHKELSFRTLPFSKQLVALVMVFDLNDESSFTALQDWAVSIDVKKFDILLCIGNKADLMPGHYAHAEYRRYLQKHGESSSDPHPEYLDYGIHEDESSSLLGDEEPSLGIRKLCSEWCMEYNIEYIEACASNAAFDKCLSVDGDIQGVDRLAGALSAHMWPGMILRSGNTISASYQIKKEETSDEESDYEIEYEVLSTGSEEIWDYVGHSDSSFIEPPAVNTQDGYSKQVTITDNQNPKHETANDDRTKDCVSTSEVTGGATSTSLTDHALATGTEVTNTQSTTVEDQDQEEERDGPVNQVSTSGVELLKNHMADVAEAMSSDGDAHVGVDDLERFMCDISGMRDNLRLMPDFQRREMAAKLAMKMASMFVGESSDEDGI